MDVRLPDGTVVQGVPDGTTRAQLAQKLKANGHDVPDDWTASAPAAPAEPKDTRSDARKMQDMADMPGDLIGSAVRGAVAAPIANMAGLARTAYEGFFNGSKGDGDAPIQTKKGVREVIAPGTQNPELKKLMAPVGAVAAPIGQALHAGGEWLRGDGPANSPRGMAANAAIEGMKQVPNLLGAGGIQAAPKVVGAVDRGVDTLMGASAKAAKGEALTATRGALGDVDANLGRQVADKHTEANLYADEAVRTQRALDAARQRGAKTSDELGTQMRDSYLKVMEDAKAARTKEVEPLYAKARASAAAREAQGQFVDVKPAVKDLDEMLSQSENLPDLHAKLLKLRQSVEAAAPKEPPAAPVGGGKVTSRMTAPAAPAGPVRPLSYAELDMASRYVKDIAFSGEAEGYGALIRNTAKRLSVKLDEQIAKAVPEHAAATAKYRELSEPMETLGTRIGAALHDTEGGLKGDAYAKVPTQDLPARVFAKRDRIEQLVDALAGGKKATPAARAAAQAKVDTWVENWILDKTGDKVGAEAQSAIAVPGMRAALNAAPGARESLGRTFADEARMQKGVPELGKTTDASRAEAATIAKRQADIRSKIEKADIDLEHGNQKAAYDAYVSSLRASMGATDPDKYRAAIALIERAGELEEKTQRARKIAMGWVKVAGYAGGAAIGANEVRKVLQ